MASHKEHWMSKKNFTNELSLLTSFSVSAFIVVVLGKNFLQALQTHKKWF